jgi:hypothetical protein
LANAKLVIGGLVAAVVSGVGSYVTVQVVNSTPALYTGLWTLVPTLFAVAAVMALIIAAFGMFM